MNEFNPNSEQDLTPDAAARFVLVLAASVVLHLALAFGIRIKAAQPVARSQPAMEVRIERAQVKVKSLLLTESAADRVEKKVEMKPSEEKPVQPPPAPAEPAPAILPALEIPLFDDPTWYPAKQVDVHPSPLQPVLPDYPPNAGEKGVAGTITLLLLIDEQGIVKEVSVVEAKPEGYFEESAMGAFRAARFAPAQKNGRAVKSRVLIRVTYELGSASKSGIQPPAPFRP